MQVKKFFPFFVVAGAIAGIMWALNAGKSEASELPDPTIDPLTGVQWKPPVAYTGSFPATGVLGDRGYITAPDTQEKVDIYQWDGTKWVKTIYQKTNPLWTLAQHTTTGPDQR